MTTTLPSRMTAYRFKPSVGKPVSETLNVPSPSSDQVLVKILAAGVCHSDLTLLEPKSGIHAQMTAVNPAGFTLGHEGSGVIVALGSGVASTNPELTVGSYVAIHTSNSCYKSSCYNCSHGMHNRCDALPYGLGSDGAWAAYVAIRASSAVLVPGTPERIPPGVVSTATDAVLTPYHAMKTCCGLQPEHTILCLGVGGLGFNAIGIAKRCLGVQRVIACDTRDVSLQLARDAGADYVATPDNLISVIEKNNLVVDFAFDFVGSQSTFDLCFSAIRCLGTIHVVGLAVSELNVPPLAMLAKELTYKTSFYGTKQELVEVLQAISDGALAPKVEMRPMSDIFQVLDDMHNGKLTSRVALYPPHDFTTAVSL